MSMRFYALKEVLRREAIEVQEPSGRSELFSKNVFTQEVMRRYMTKEAYHCVIFAIEQGGKIDRRVADQVACAMRDWAKSKGATHYTHWFQPLNGTTAEKHDAFFDPIDGGIAIDRFGGGQLVQQESDASSFPNGGLRNTFEARGYTAWDPSSPAFVLGTVLCIPTVFISYTGEALDHKVPLLRALSAIDTAARDVARYFDKNVNKVTVTLGWEQEYFLVDKALVASRSDLSLVGRTLLGHSPAKGQQMEDHYFGSIAQRAVNFMREVEIEALKLGIPLKTRHNEAAPGQYEIAPIFEEANLAVDHNSLLMDLMRKIGLKHNFSVLFHEKPFSGINGSGKHNNWSLLTDTGVNLLSPGTTPMKNLQFLTFFICTICAVCRYEELLRAAVASQSNDYRLGANEAPPAIVSVFIGDYLTKILDELEGVSHGRLSAQEKTDLKLNVVGKIPDVLLDNTDRNRTSTFAFTGNKFEFRAVGSKTNCGKPMMVLNTIVAKQLCDFKSEVDSLIDGGLKKDDAIFNVLRQYIKSSRAVLFEGDGYSKEWEEEAKRRGLSNHRTTPEALGALVSEKVENLFCQMGVMSKREIEARYEIELEEYVKNMQIESRVIGDIARNHIVPTAVNYQHILVGNVQGLKDIFQEDYLAVAQEQIDLIKRISSHISEIHKMVDEMVEQRKIANAIENMKERAFYYCNEVKPFLSKIRYHCDKLEIMVDDNIWPLPKYRELLFTN